MPYGPNLNLVCGFVEAMRYDSNFAFAIANGEVNEMVSFLGNVAIVDVAGDVVLDFHGVSPFAGPWPRRWCAVPFNDVIITS